MATHELLPKPAMDNRPASLQLRQALREKGYRAVGTQVTQGPRTKTVFTLWSNGQHELLMETFEDGDGGALCEVYRTLVTTNSIAETIAAIP